MEGVQERQRARVGDERHATGAERRQHGGGVEHFWVLRRRLARRLRQRVGENRGLVQPAVDIDLRDGISRAIEREQAQHLKRLALVDQTARRDPE